VGDVIALLPRLDCGNASLAGLPTCQLNRLQSVLHAAARLVCGTRKYDHVTPLLQELQWLSVPDRITFKLATLVFRCMHGLAQAYLAGTLNRAADVDSRRRLHSGSSTALLVPMTRRRTLGDRAFPVAAALVWNRLPVTLTSQSSLLTFRQQLKTFLFEKSYSRHPCYIALDTTFLRFNFFDIVSCPCSSLSTKCYVNLFLYE